MKRGNDYLAKKWDDLAREHGHSNSSDYIEYEKWRTKARVLFDEAAPLEEKAKDLYAQAYNQAVKNRLLIDRMAEPWRSEAYLEFIKMALKAGRFEAVYAFARAGVRKGTPDEAKRQLQNFQYLRLHIDGAKLVVMKYMRDLVLDGPETHVHIDCPYCGTHYADTDLYLEVDIETDIRKEGPMQMECSVCETPYLVLGVQYILDKETYGYDPGDNLICLKILDEGGNNK